MVEYRHKRLKQREYARNPQKLTADAPLSALVSGNPMLSRRLHIVFADRISVCHPERSRSFGRRGTSRAKPMLREKHRDLRTAIAIWC